MKGWQCGHDILSEGISHQMNDQIQTITIGISAYNEEANIAYLLDDILCQKEDRFVIEKIFIISDGSSDRTTELVRTIVDPRIQVTAYPDRKGKTARVSEILAATSSDIVVILDADVALRGESFVANIVRPIMNGKADLVGTKVVPVAAETFIEKVLEASMRLKTALFEGYCGGHNVYTCSGAARAISRRLYSQLRFPDKVGEDAYSYFVCITNGFTYAYAKDAVVMNKLPETLHDHILQSERFAHSREQFYADFDINTIKREYKLPLWPAVRLFFSSGIKFALYILLYVVIVSVVHIKSLFSTSASNLWLISKSSKDLRRNKGI